MSGLVADPFADVVGQQEALHTLRGALGRPVHAYLFVGPAGSGKRRAALAFAAALLGDERARVEGHPDVEIIEREGASISVAQARETTRLAARSAGASGRKVLILVDFHLVGDAAPALLKTIEEASPSTTFIVLAESVPKELVTIASRCVRVDFGPIPEGVIVTTLVGEGADPERAVIAARSASGSLDRARLLVLDDDVVARSALWAGALDRLDGSGASVAVLVEEVLAAVDHATAPLLARHAAEREQVQLRIQQDGLPSKVLKDLELRHKRELRRQRTDELRAGLAIVARQLGEWAKEHDDPRYQRWVSSALSTLAWANAGISNNPNETLLLQGVFVRLVPPPAVRAMKAAMAASTSG